MRAVVMRPGRLDVEERPRPVPGPGEVLVRTLACGICGSDIHLFRHAQSFYDQALNAGVDKAILDRGVVLGHEFVGEIIDFGPATIRSLEIGQRVCSIPFLPNRLPDVPIGATPLLDGAYADYFLLHESLLIPVPDSLSTEKAALVEPLAIGIHAINSANLQDKPTCVVLGCGPIGLSVITALAAEGISSIIATDLSARRREIALALGASVTTDPAETSVFTALADKQPQPAIIFECTGVNGIIEFCIAGAPTRSEIIIAGISHGEDTITPATAIAKELSLRFVSFYQTEEFEQALTLLSDGDVDSTDWITDKISLEDVPEMLMHPDKMERQTKVLIVP